MSNTYKPTLAHAMSIFAYHIGEIMTAEAAVRVHFFGDIVGDYRFETDRTYRAAMDGSKISDTAKQAQSDGYYCIGNRCAAREDYTARCLPVLLAIATAEDNGVR